MDEEECLEQLFDCGPVSPIYLDGRVSGVKARLMLDSGAGLSYVSPAFAERHSGLAVRKGKFRKGITTTGETVIFSKYAVSHVECGEADFVSALALVSTPPGADVVIGRNLMKAHHWIVSHRSGRVLARGRVVAEGQVERTTEEADEKNEENEKNEKNEKNETTVSAGGNGRRVENEDVGRRPVDAPSTREKKKRKRRPGRRRRENEGEEEEEQLDEEKEKRERSEPDEAGGRKGGRRHAGASPPESEPGEAEPQRAVKGRAPRKRRLPGFLRDETFALGSEAQKALRRHDQIDDDGAETLTALCAMEIEDIEDEDQKNSEVVEDETEKEFVESLKKRYPETFSATLTRQPPLRSVNFSVELTEDAKPLPHRAPYPLSSEQRKALQEIVDEMAAAGLIRRHDGPASCPMFLVKKKTLPGQKPRFRAVLDARPRNAQTAARPFSAPRVDMELPKLRGAKVTSCVDATQAFYQVRIVPEQEHLFSFCDPAGTVWRMTCMPMGCTNAMAVLADLTAVIFEDFIRNGEMVPYADDWALVSGSKEEHRDLLERFVRRCSEQQIVLHPDKSKFFTDRVNFLGYTIRGDEATPIFDKIAAVRDYPVPTTVTEVRRFLGMANYYSNLIPRFRVVAAALDKLTGMKLDDAGRHRNKKFEWGKEQQASFDELKELLTSEPVIMLPDLEKGQFTLRADASVDGLGAVLEQEGDDGQMRPVAYYSRKTTEAERRMDIRTLELLAVVSALDRMYMWLGGAVIDVWTDHRSLVYLSESCPVSRRLVRTLDVLQQHRMRWHYIPGTENVVADALSRREDFVEDDTAENTKVFRRYMKAALRMAEGHGDVTDADLIFDGSAFEEPETKGGGAAIYPITVLAALSHVHLVPEESFANEFREGYKDDPFFAPIQKALREGARQGPLEMHDNYYEVDGLLYHHHVLYGSRLCVPRGDALNHVLAAAHDDIGHFGMKKTVSALTRVFFPRLRQTVEAYVRGCAACQRAKARHGQRKGELMPLPIPARPWTDISLDFVGGLPEVYGKNGILTVVDRRSKEVRAIPMRLTDGESSAEAVVDALLEHVYQYSGPFFSILSDRGTQFTSRLFRDITERLGVSLRMSTAYHPETDGQTERYNKVLAESLRATLNNGDYQWPDVLPFVVYGINSTVHQALGCSPFEASSGRAPLQWLDAVGRPHSLENNIDDEQSLRVAVDRMVQQALEEAQQKYKASVDVKRRPAPVFTKGQRVMVRSAVLQSKAESELMGNSRKLMSKYVGPLRVVEKINANAYRIELPRGSRAHDVINVQHLEKYQPSGTYGRKDAPPPVWVAEDGDYYEPEQILKHRMWSGHGAGNPRVEYLVSWAGYGAEENSWLGVDDLSLCLGMLKAYWAGIGKTPPAGALP